MPRLLVLARLAAVPLLLASSAHARFDLASGFPWSRSVTGSETVTDLGVDLRGRPWVVGNVTNPGSGRDILLQIYSITQTGTPISVTVFDWSLGEEGPPSIALTAQLDVPYALVGFSSSLTGATQLAIFLSRITKDDTMWRGLLPLNGLPGGRLNDIAVDGSGTPYVAGSLIYSDREPLLYYRWSRNSNNNIFDDTLPVDWYPYDAGTKAFIDGRGVVADGFGNSWVVGVGGGDLWLLKYTNGSYYFVNAMSLLRPENAWIRSFPTPTADEPWALDRDVFGNLWVAGATNGQAAVWKFSSDGVLVPGFPRLVAPGCGGSVLNALVIDSQRRCFAVGTCGSAMLFTGVDERGVLLPGFPMTVSVTESVDSGTQDSLAGGGIGFAPGGSLWIAATVTASPLSTVWKGTYTKLFLYWEVPALPEVALGNVLLRVRSLRGVGGAVLNVMRGEMLEILARPTAAGLVRARIVTMRGEILKEFSGLGTGGQQMDPFIWNGQNNAGEVVASGTYALVVTGGGLKVTRRVVVIHRK